MGKFSLVTPLCGNVGTCSNRGMNLGQARGRVTDKRDLERLFMSSWKTCDFNVLGLVLQRLKYTTVL